MFRFRVSYAPAAVLRQIISALAFSGLAGRVQDSAEAPFGDGIAMMQAIAMMMAVVVVIGDDHVDGIHDVAVTGDRDR